MNERLTQLFDRYFSKTASSEEKSELQQLIDTNENRNQLLQLIDHSWNTFDGNGTDGVSEEKRIAILNKIIHSAKVKQITKRTPFFTSYKVIAAAILILAIGSGLYYFNHQSYKSDKSSPITVQTNDAAPGSNKAIWTLANGKQIELDSTELNMITLKPLSDMGFNELRTPRGGQYKLILPDGSKVWLNAASSIKYPVVFEGKERRVDVTGEVYFEIEKNTNKPFKVYSNGQVIEVLGTAFNVNAYDNEPFKTSLSEGTIKVNQLLLKPGQAYINGQMITTNIEQDLAWKNGYFSFENLTLPEMARQIERWYDITIVFQGSYDDILLKGEMDRSVNLSDLLRLFNDYGFTTTLKDRTLFLKTK